MLSGKNSAPHHCEHGAKPSWLKYSTIPVVTDDMHNERNYYRILHVQYDAPPAVIKASYRAIMQKLRAHPDLGGDQWNASLINEARNVLLDPVRRAEYDLKHGSAGSFDSSVNRSHTVSDAGGRPHHESNPPERTAYSKKNTQSAGLAITTDTAIPNSWASCPFCRNPSSQRLSALQLYPTVHRCSHCNAPLKTIDDNWLKKQNELRKINRSELEQVVKIWDRWPRNSGYSANVCDWSTAGCCIQLNHTLTVDSVVLLLSPTFEAIATVRYQSDSTFFGLEFLTLEVNMKPGSLFVSEA